MGDFYPREEVVMYELEEMDSQVIEATWELNEIKRKKFNDRHSAAYC